MDYAGNILRGGCSSFDDVREWMRATLSLSLSLSLEQQQQASIKAAQASG
jgi:hypothetical protein